MFNTMSEEFMADLIRFRHEVKKNTNAQDTGSDFMCVARAEQKHTLKQIVEWGEEDCSEHQREYDEYKRRNCPHCWRELREAI